MEQDGEDIPAKYWVRPLNVKSRLFVLLTLAQAGSGAVSRRSSSEAFKSSTGVGAAVTSPSCNAATAKQDNLERKYMMVVVVMGRMKT